MSFRKKVQQAKSSTTSLDVAALQQLQILQDAAARLGLSPEEYQSMTEIERDAARSLKESNKAPIDNFKKISDMSVNQGIVVNNPLTGKNEGYLDACGDLRSMEGKLHPATENWLRRMGKL